MERIEKTVRSIITALLGFFDEYKENQKQLKNRIEVLEEAQEQFTKDFYGPHGKRTMGSKAKKGRNI